MALYRYFLSACYWRSKYVKDGYALVDVDIVSENQRGELTTKGLATFKDGLRVEQDAA